MFAICDPIKAVFRLRRSILAYWKTYGLIAGWANFGGAALAREVPRQ